MQASVIFTDTLKALRYGARRVIHQGGQNSGKTVNILGVLATLASEEDGGVTTVTGVSFPHLKGGALRDFEMFVYPTFKNAIKQYHRTDRIFTFKSGSIIEFKVFETEQDARGAKRKRLFVNEANKYDWLKFFQLDSRSEQSILDYNPSIRFWAHENLIGEPGNHTLISNHLHNPFISEDKHLEIENLGEWIRDKYGNYILDGNGKRIPKRGNEELWKVYARGLTGNVTGLIFPDWVKIDDNDFIDDNDCVFGIDFGYTNDPTTIIKMYKIGESLFVKELCYEPGLPARSICNILKANGWRETSPVYCEHDPDMIRQIRMTGITNAFPARKGQGSINAGIEALNQVKVFYTASSRNMDEERKKYIWEEDKEGKITNIPVDNNNHTFDATRYGYYSHYLKHL